MNTKNIVKKLAAAALLCGGLASAQEAGTVQTATQSVLPIWEMVVFCVVVVGVIGLGIWKSGDKNGTAEQ